MERRIRKLFFWILVIFFIITVSILIPYALGFRYNPDRGIFTYTGLITIKSNPQRVDISVNGKPVERKKINRLNNSYNIDGLDPGEYLLEVNLPGFNTWKKKVTINSGISTEFWNVLITKENYDRTAFGTNNVDNFFYDTQKKLAAYTLNDGEYFSVNILDVEESTIMEKVFTSDEYYFTEDKKENIEWEPRTRRIIVPVMKNQERNYFLVDIDTKEFIDLKELSNTTQIKKVRWDPNDRNYVYYISENNLFRMHVSDSNDKKLVAENISGYDLSSGRVYYFQLPGGIIYSTNTEESSEPIQVTTSPPEEMEDSSYQITIYDEDRISLLNESGSLYIYNIGEDDEYFRKLSDNTEEVQFSDDGKKMLFWNGWEIYVYFLRDWEVQPFRYENEEKDITRFSTEISNVQWSKDYEHVIFSTEGKIKIIEIDNRDNRNLMDITPLKINNTVIASDFPDDKLLFIDKNGESTGIYSIDFPEETGIF